MVRYLTADELVVGKRYRIDQPINYGGRHIRTTYARFVGRAWPRSLEFNDGPGGFTMSDEIISTNPITDRPADTAVRISLSGHDVMVSKALGRVPSDTERHIRKFGGKSRKTRRRGKKTLRRK